MCGQFIAFKYAYKCAKKDRYKDISKQDLVDMIMYVNSLLSGNECGRFRNEQRYVKGGGSGANWTPVEPEKISEKIEGKSEQDILPILMAAMTSARKQNISFSSQEFEILFSILKEGKSEQEVQQINQTIDFARNVLSKNKF